MEIAILASFFMSKAVLAAKIDIQSNRDVTNDCILHFPKSTILYFIFYLQLGIKWQLKWSRGVFIKRSNAFIPQQEHFLSSMYF